MSEDRWARIAEIGSMRALRFAAWFHDRFGRRPSVAVLWLPAAYYLARSRHARRGSLQYQERLWSSPEGRAALGRRPGLAVALRHIYEFAVGIYDRMVAWGGALDSLEFDHDGSEKLFEFAAAGRGALLLGAHLGNVDLLWSVSRKYHLVVNVVAFYGNAERINAFFESLAPDCRLRVIELDPGSVRAAFEIKACIDRGEVVVVLADRVPPGRTERSADVAFLGRPARFPLGPFLLGSVLGCDVMLALCVRTGPGRYRTLLRPLAEPARTPRYEHEKRARELLGSYVDLLESFCLRHPLQWFNFYEFWDVGQEARS